MESPPHPPQFELPSQPGSQKPVEKPIRLPRCRPVADPTTDAHHIPPKQTTPIIHCLPVGHTVPRWTLILCAQTENNIVSEFEVLTHAAIAINRLFTKTRRGIV